MAGQWPKAQVDAKRREFMAKHGATGGTLESRELVNGDSVTLSIADAALVREAVKMAIETISDTLQTAERSNRASILTTLERYRADLQALLERLQ